MESKGWGKNLGDKNGKLTLDELKASLKEKGIDLATLIRDEKITGKAITDALTTKAVSPAATASVTLPQAPNVVAINSQMRR